MAKSLKMITVITWRNGENGVDRTEQACDCLISSAESIQTLAEKNHAQSLVNSLIVPKVHLRLKTFSEYA